MNSFSFFQVMEQYFLHEKIESWIFIILGSIAITASVVLWIHQAELKSAAYPLVAIGLIQIIVGSSIVFRTATQISTLQQSIQEQPRESIQKEEERMNTVMKNFVVYRYIELVLFCIGVVACFLLPDSRLYYGIGLGLILQSALMLTADLVAEYRGEQYLHAIQSFATSV